MKKVSMRPPTVEINMKEILAEWHNMSPTSKNLFFFQRLDFATWIFSSRPLDIYYFSFEFYAHAYDVDAYTVHVQRTAYSVHRT